MEFVNGQRVELKNNNLEGIGRKGQRGIVVSQLYRPVDGYDLLVRFDDGTTEGFYKTKLQKVIKQLTRL